MPSWRLTSTASSRAPTWLSGVCCDVIPFIPAASIRYPRSHSIITSHFGHRCLPSDCRCENLEYVDIPVFSHLASLEVPTHRIANLFFLEPLAPGQPQSADAVGTSPQILKKPIRPAIPYLSSASKRYLMVPTRKCFGCSPFERRRTETTSSLTA